LALGEMVASAEVDSLREIFRLFLFFHPSSIFDPGSFPS